jgi:hypothetical protein
MLKRWLRGGTMAGVTAAAASRWVALAVAASLVVASPAAATRNLDPADYVTIDAVAGCDDPLTLTNSVVWTVRNGNDVPVEIEGVTTLSPLGTRVWQPGQTETVVTSGINRYWLWNNTISGTVGVKLPGDTGSRFVIKDVVLPNCEADKPIVTFAEVCEHIDVTMTLSSDAAWPFAVRIRVNGDEHSVHILNPGEQKTVRVPSFAGSYVSAENAREVRIADYRDMSTRPCHTEVWTGSGDSSGTGGRSPWGPPAVGGGAPVGPPTGGGAPVGPPAVPTPSAETTASPTTASPTSASSSTDAMSVSPFPVSSGRATPVQAAKSADDASLWTRLLLAFAGTLVGAVILSGAVFVVRQRRSRNRSLGP